MFGKEKESKFSKDIWKSYLEKSVLSSRSLQCDFKTRKVKEQDKLCAQEKNMETT